MTRELQFLCAFLWHAIGGRAHIQGGAPNWAKWLALADEHKLAPFLYHRLRSDPPWPNEVRAELAARYVPSGFLNGLRLREQMRLLMRLTSHADFVVLKGAALSLLLYEEAAERDMVDLDLFFPTERDVETALEILRTLQYAPTHPMPGHHHLPPMLHRSGRLSVELHTNLTSPPLPASFLRRFFADRVFVCGPNGFAIPVADRPHLLFHHCLHTLKDPIESPLVRNLFEIAWLAKGLSSQEWARFFVVAEASGRSEIARRALALARDLFPVELPTFRRPAYSSIEFWARRRLGWISDALGPAARRFRHIAVKHFDTMPTGRWSWDLPDMARVVATSILNGMRTRLRPFLAPHRRSLLRRAPLVEADFAGGVALLRTASGQVFVLREAAAAAWKEARQPRSGVQLSRRLVAAGASARAAREAVRALVAMEVLEPARTQEYAGGDRSSPL